MKGQFLAAVIAAITLGTAAHAANAQSSDGGNAYALPGVPADNTKSNKLDSSNTTAVADAQKDNSNDRSLTQRIRKSVIADKSLSMYAHNVKVVAVNGTVTLNGVVRSEEEKAAVEKKAVAIAGADKVVNDLKVAASK